MSLYCIMFIAVYAGMIEELNMSLGEMSLYCNMFIAVYTGMIEEQQERNIDFQRIWS